MYGDLLEQAKQLATTDRGRPKQVNLRRAVSATYYAMFHFLVDQSARFRRSDVMVFIDECEDAIRAFEQLPLTNEKRFFLACLWAWGMLSKR